MTFQYFRSHGVRKAISLELAPGGRWSTPNPGQLSHYRDVRILGGRESDVLSRRTLVTARDER